MDLSQDLRLESVLDKTIETAQRAVPGREFALLVMVEDALQVVRTSGLGPGARRRIESWAQSNPDLLAETRELRELGEDEDLDRLALRLDVGELRADPLLAKGRSLGVLVTLAAAVEPFDESERQTLAGFTEQAALALANAHMFQHL